MSRQSLRTLRRTRLFLWLLLITLLPLLSLLPAAPVIAQDIPAQDVPIIYEHINTALTLQQDGALHVRIVQQMRFDGEFSGAFYAIPVDNITSVANVQLFGAATEQDNFELDTVDLAPIAPNSIENSGDEIVIDWNFPRTRRGDVRLFVIEYDAYGVVWVYPDGDFISWKAIGEDRSGITVDNAEVKLTLPEIVPVDQVTTTDSFGRAAASVTGHTITFAAADSIPDGESFIVEAHFPHGVLNVGVREWQRAYDGEQVRVDVQRFDSSLVLNADGSMNVREQTTLSVREGTLHQGTRSLRLLYVDAITDPAVAINGQALVEQEGECSGCFQVTNFDKSRWVFLDPDTEQLSIDEDNSGEYHLDWYAAQPVQAGGTLTTTLSYVAQGVVRVGPENQLLTWQVVPDFDQPIAEASLRLTLPPRVTPDEIHLEGPAEQGSGELQPDGSLVYRFDGPVVPGAWQIALTLPAGATNAAKPLWQQDFEEVMAQADAAAVRHARNTLITRVIGVLALVGAALIAIYAWFRWGRRKVKEALGGYLSEPPSRQSPALVAYLVDRKASERGVLGTIFYLASFKLLEIDLDDGIKLRRVHDEPLQGTPRRTDVYGESVTLPRHVAVLFDQVLLPGLPLNQWASLDSIAPRLRDNLPEIYSSMAADMQRFFIAIPGSESDTVPGSVWFFTYLTLLGLMFFEIIPWYLGFVIGFVVLVAFVVWSALHQTGRGAYTDAGALEADRWRRFKTYLQEIKKYGDQGAAQEILDRYFGYAVALGVENVVIAQAAQMGSLRPIWMPTTSGTTTPGTQSQRPDVNSPRPQSGPIQVPWPRPRPSAPPVATNRPTLAGMSEQLGHSVAQASRTLGGLLATAAGDADSAARSVVVNSNLRRREMTWQPHTPVTRILDDIMRQSVADAREVQAREIARRAAARASSRDRDWLSSGSRGGGSSSSRSSSRSRSSSSFGRSSSRSSSSHSSSRSSSSSSRSSGGGRSGFR